MTPTRTDWLGGSNQTGDPFWGNEFTKPGTANPGDWMILVITTNSDVDVDVNLQGWTVIAARSQTNTMYSTVLARVVEVGDTLYHIPITGGGLTCSVMWGTGAAPVNEWTTGSWMTRASTGTSTTNVANPGITTTEDDSLVITVSTERTTLTEANITSMAGATAWYFQPHVSGFIETHSVGYAEQASAGSTPNVTVTYPNSQATNGNIVQFALPPGEPEDPEPDPDVDPAFRAAAFFNHEESNPPGPQNTQITLQRPAEVELGDYGMIMISMADGTPPTFTVPTGWDELLEPTVTGTMRTVLYGKKYELGDNATISITATVGNSYHAVGVWFNGEKVDGVETTGDYGTRPSTSAATTAPAVTAAGQYRRVVSVFTHRTAAAPTLDNVTYGEVVYHHHTVEHDNNRTGISFVERMLASTNVLANTAEYSSGSVSGLGIQLVMVTLDGGPSSGQVSTSLVSDFSHNSLRLGAIVTGGHSARVVVSTEEDFSTPIYGAMTIAPSDWATGRVTGLTPGTQYYVGIEINSVIQTDVQHYVRTLYTPGEPASFVVAAGSCQTSASNPVVFPMIAADDALFLVHMGDLHYADATTEGAWRTATATALSKSNIQTMFETVPMSWHWDNHDRIIIDALNTGTTDPATTEGFRELWGNDFPEAGSGDPVYKTWVSGRVRFIHTDCWTARVPSGDTESPSKTMLGLAQRQWIKDTLAAAEEPIIVWFASFPNHRVANGRWNSYQNETTDLENWIATHPSVKERLIMVGGDSHDIRADSGSRLTGSGGAQNFINVPSLNASGFHQWGSGWVTNNWDIAEIALPATNRGCYARLSFDDNGQRIAMTWEAVYDDGSILASWTRTVGTLEVDGTPATMGYWNGGEDRMIPAWHDDS